MEEDVTRKIQLPPASQAQLQALKAAQDWQRTFDHIADSVFIQDKDFKIIKANKATFEMFGLKPEELIGKKCFEVFHKSDKPWKSCPFIKTRIDKKPHTEEVQDPLLKYPLMITTSPIFDESGEFAGSVHIAKNISEQKKAEEESKNIIAQLKQKEKDLERVNRTLRALTNNGQYFARATEEMNYLKDVCKIIIEDCGYQMVWIGYAQDNEEKSVKPVAFAGFEEGYLKTLRVTWADEPRGRGPTGTAIRTNKITFCRNMAEDANFSPWKQEALKRGYRSSICLPLVENGKPFGSITIYSKEMDGFPPDEVALLKEFTDDVAFGVSAMRAKKATVEAEKALQESEERLRAEKEILDTIMKNAGASLAYLDKEFNFIAVNSAFCLNNGRTQEELLGNNYFAFFPSDENRLLFEKIIETGEQVEFKEKPLILKNQPWREITYWDWKLIPIKNTSANGLVISLVDVSEHVKLENELKLHGKKAEQIASELKKVQTAVENASDIIFITDEKGKIIYINKAVKEILGYKQTELIGRRPNFWLEEMPNKFFAQMWNSIYFEKKPFAGEIQDRKKDGDIFMAEIRIAPVLDKNGQILSFVAIERDVTEARRLDMAKTEFISLATHQLRTPITSVGLTTEMLLNDLAGKISKESEEYLDEIMTSVKKMSDMIDLFLNVSRIEMKTFEIVPRPQNIVQIIDENIKLVAHQCKAKELDLQKNISEDLPIINADPKVLDIALENLLTNAIKYTPSKGAITVEAEKYRGSIVIKVSDTGYGISKKDQAKIFEKLYRTENTSLKAEGVGLGLFLTKALIEQSGGKIWVESERNRGSTFFISIPLAGMRANKRKK